MITQNVKNYGIARNVVLFTVKSTKCFISIYFLKSVFGHII